MLNTSFMKSLRIAQFAVVSGLYLSSMVLLAQGPGVGAAAGAGARANAAGSGMRHAQELQKVLRQRDGGNAAQQQARDRIIDAARRAGQQHPDDRSAVDKAVKKALNDARERAEGGSNGRGNRDNGLRDWVMRLKAFLMDIGVLDATDATRKGESKAEQLAQRIGAEVTSNDDQKKTAREVADAARAAGRLFPDDEDKVVDAVNKALKEAKAKTTQGETKTWLSGLAEGLRRGRYGAFDLISITPEPTIAPAGSRVVMTGVVVAGQPATVTAVGPTGAVLAGTVIEVAGEEKVTDAKGRVRFIVPGAIATVAAILPGVLKSPPSIATVRPQLPPNPADGVDYTPPMPGNNGKPVIERAPRASARSRVPMIDHAPPNPTPGSTMTITGTGFSGDVGGNSVQVGDNTSEVLASSPAEIVAVVPADATVGPQSVVVVTADGESNTYPTEVTQIWFEAADTQLNAGQTGKGYLRVSCDSPQTIALSNDNDVISLTAGNAQVVRTSGGANNGAPVLYVANRPGMFSVRAEIVDPSDPVAQDDDDDSDEDDNEKTPRQWAREAEKSALAAARAAEKAANRITIANATADLGSFAGDDRRWEDDGSEKYRKGMKKALEHHMEKMERLATQAERTEADNPTLADHLWAVRRALRRALTQFEEDTE